MKKIITTLAALILLPLQVVAVEVIDGNNPKYISSVESLSRAVQLMNSLQVELLEVYNLNALPGYNPSREMARIQEMKARANFILSPEKKRLMVKPLVIDGAYVTKSLSDIPLKLESK